MLWMFHFYHTYDLNSIFPFHYLVNKLINGSKDPFFFSQWTESLTWPYHFSSIRDFFFFFKILVENTHFLILTESHLFRFSAHPNLSSRLSYWILINLYVICSFRMKSLKFTIGMKRSVDELFILMSGSLFSSYYQLVVVNTFSGMSFQHRPR